MTHDPHNSPLDPDEQALARVLQALPAGEPPSAMDARILAAARDALEEAPAAPSQHPRPARRWGVGLGVAASAVLAVGIAWRMQTEAPQNAYSEAPQDVSSPARTEGAAAPVAAPASPPPLDAMASREARTQESKTTTPVPEEPPVVFDDASSMDMASLPALADTPEPAEAAILEEEQAALAPLTQTMPAPAAPPAPPAPPPPPMVRNVDIAPPPMVAPPPPPKLSRLNELSERRQRNETQAAPVPAPTASGAVQPLPLPAVEDDFALYPESWLIRIEERRRAGDLQGATQSLAAFRARYPAYPIPEALQPLLQP